MRFRHRMIITGALLLLAWQAVAQDAATSDSGGEPPAETEASPSGSATETASPNVVIDWRGSVMFSTQEMASLRTVYEAFVNRAERGEDSEQPQDDFLSDILESTPQNNQQRKIPVFYLSSVAYLRPGYWMVWLNGKKLEPVEPTHPDGITVEKVKGNTVLFSWKPPSLNQAQSTLEKTNMPDAAPNPNRVKKAYVAVDREKGVVLFILKPNQTFNGDLMQVMEGKVTPVAAVTAIGTPDAAEINAPEVKPPVAGSATPTAPAAVKPQAPETTPLTPAVR